VAAAPYRRWQTPGGFTLSVAMTNCGSLGWVSDWRGYRYQATDPAGGQPWPPMPSLFRELAGAAAAAAGFPGFSPDACLVNRYIPGARMSLHQDKDETDFSAPIVSVSLGLPAVFQFGGDTRSARPQRIPVHHGDVVVFGGAARLRFHGVSPIEVGQHPLLGSQRVNLTFRRAR
jgi:alkylated DNA repair protein (DNA oxidative demethylase)